MSDYTLTEDKALAAILQVEAEQAAPIQEYPDNYVVLDCGAVLEITGITSETYNAVVRKFEDKEPRPPIVKIVSKGREEANPNDPDYLDKLAKWKNSRAAGLLLAIYAFGTRVVSVPDSMPGPDSEEFKSGLSLAGLLTNGNATECRIHWIQNALSRDKARGASERTAIFKAAIRAMGVAESDTQEAVKRV